MKIGRGRGLIVEDNEALAFTMEDYLDELNIKADKAYNGQEAIDKVRVVDYDFILMDIHMPIMNGLEATKQIIALRPTSIILVITSSHEKLEWRRMQSLGAKECLQKPVDRIQLLELIQRHVIYLK